MGDVKLALDAEISTYRELLEGEDMSFPIPSYGGSAIFLSSSPGPSLLPGIRSDSPANPALAEADAKAGAEEKVSAGMSFTETSYTYTVTEEVIETESKEDVIQDSPVAS